MCVCAVCAYLWLPAFTQNENVTTIIVSIIIIIAIFNCLANWMRLKSRHSCFDRNKKERTNEHTHTHTNFSHFVWASFEASWSEYRYLFVFVLANFFVWMEMEMKRAVFMFEYAWERIVCVCCLENGRKEGNVSTENIASFYWCRFSIPFEWILTDIIDKPGPRWDSESGRARAHAHIKTREDKQQSKKESIDVSRRFRVVDWPTSAFSLFFFFVFWFFIIIFDEARLMKSDTWK